MTYTYDIIIMSTWWAVSQWKHRIPGINSSKVDLHGNPIVVQSHFPCPGTVSVFSGKLHVAKHTFFPCFWAFSDSRWGTSALGFICCRNAFKTKIKISWLHWGVLRELQASNAYKTDLPAGIIAHCICSSEAMEYLHWLTLSSRHSYHEAELVFLFIHSLVLARLFYTGYLSQRI